MARTSIHSHRLQRNASIICVSGLRNLTHTQQSKRIPMSENLPNKAVFQSYIWTCAKYDFSPYEKRIIYRLIEFAQHWLEGVKIKDHMHKIEPTDCGVNITMPVADILRDETDNNYAKAKAAFTSLSKKGAEYEDDEIWFYTAIIEHPQIKKGTGIATFHVYEPVWRAALDFTKGFKKYELVTAMKFKSVYAMRFYELMSGQTTPLFVPLESSDGLRERFNLQGKYERVNDFRRKVIDVTKKELDKFSPYSFVAKEEKKGKKVIGWTLFPVFFEDREDPALQEQARMAKVTARFQLENNIYDYLKFSFDFKSDEINKNKKALIEGQNRIPNFMGFLGELKKGARLAENPKGYVIGAIKRKLKEM